MIAALDPALTGAIGTVLGAALAGLVAAVVAAGERSDRREQRRADAVQADAQRKHEIDVARKERQQSRRQLAYVQLAGFMIRANDRVLDMIASEDSDAIREIYLRQSDDAIASSAEVVVFASPEVAALQIVWNERWEEAWSAASALCMARSGPTERPFDEQLKAHERAVAARKALNEAGFNIQTRIRDELAESPELPGTAVVVRPSESDDEAPKRKTWWKRLWQRVRSFSWRGGRLGSG